MVVEDIRYTIDAGRTEAFHEAYRRGPETSQASEHCQRYEVPRCADDPAQHIVRIELDQDRS
jgi:quinol monooxygenase YgiN